MPAEAMQVPAASQALSMEVRASLDLLFELLAGQHGMLRTDTVGQPTLISAFANYGTLEPDRDQLTILGATEGEIRAVVERHQPQRVTLLAPGRLQRVIQPLRRSADRIPTVPPVAWWTRLGYALTRSIGIQGIGSLFWSACDRLLRRVDWPQYADRCRIAMLRTLVAGRVPFAPSTLLVLDFRRER